ncbi:Ca-transporting ATPase [Gautieria morchelliformis]|nr:Ca-transporting ATPase [Gautieria morchelliformis]
MSAFSTAASTYSRQPVSRNGAYTAVPAPPRSESPPASAYFSGFAGPHDEPLPSAGAQAHFAYSTTLRRHNVDVVASPERQGFGPLQPLVSGVDEAGGWLRRIANGVSGGASREDRAENGWGEHSQSHRQQKETPSAKYAHVAVEEALHDFQTSFVDGLSSSVVPSLQAVHGYNEFSVESPEPVLIKFAKTIYESPLILLLFGSAVVSAAMGNVDDAVSITIAILIVLTVGFVQERRSEKSLEALNKLVPHHCHIIRDSRPYHLLANELVPGDIVTFSVGDRIPADVRLFTALELEIDESSLTGETRPARKSVEKCSTGTDRHGDTVGLSERTCIAYMGTLVRNGRGSGIVVGTGLQTEFGVIFSMMQDVEEKRTPLQLSMDDLAKRLSIVSFGVIGVIVLIGVLQHRPWLEMFTIGVSLAVAAIPEGLPIVTTVTLALGVLRMSRRKAIVKKLPSVEALGSVSVVCSDKTGTLTKNEQTVVEAYTVDELVQIDGSLSHSSDTISSALRKTLEIGCLCNNAFKNGGVHVGQSTDVALLNVLGLFGVGDLREMFTRSSESPFNSEQKFMAVSGQHTGADAREVYYIKGSIDAVLARCKFYYVSDTSSPGLDARMRSVITSKAEQVAARGLRVLAMAYGFGSVESQAQLPPEKGNLVFTGFQAMLDPPRKGVADAIDSLQRGGVQVVMITGDAEQTALSIARELGLRIPSGAASCLTGAALDMMGARELVERVGNVSVFARTTPRHKMAIVKAFQARGKVVAMTGDGVNDAPALKMADIGVSMGKSGTDVAKEAADVILVDDNFATILSAVEEGKSIFHNIQNFLSFQLSTAVAALTLITLSTFFRLHNPLNAMQILFINILMDGPPSQSLGVDPVDPAVMRKPPRKKDEPVITRRLLARVLFSASIIVLGTLFVYAHELSDGSMTNRDQTMAITDQRMQTFTCFVFLDLASALQNRGLGCGIFQNHMLLTTVSVSFLVQLCLVYVPMMQAVFQTEALAMHDLLVLLCLGATSMLLHEARRRYERSLNADDTYTLAVGEMV